MEAKLGNKEPYREPNRASNKGQPSRFDALGGPGWGQPVIRSQPFILLSHTPKMQTKPRNFCPFLFLPSDRRPRTS